MNNMSTLTIRLTDEQSATLEAFKRCNDIATGSKALLFALDDYSRILGELHHLQRKCSRLADRVEQQQDLFADARDAAK